MDIHLAAVSLSLTDAVKAVGAVAQDPDLLDRCARAAQVMVESLRRGQRVWFCGNGGSAAEAQHLAAELSGRFLKDRAALPAEALHVNSSYLTAVANDFGYDVTFARLLDGVASAGDVLVCLSTSGNSVNVVEAARTARRRQLHSIALTGPGGGALADLVDVVLSTPASVSATSRIQEIHLVLGHTICEIVEAALFPDTAANDVSSGQRDRALLHPGRLHFSTPQLPDPQQDPR